MHGLKEIFNRLDRRTYPLPTGNDVANYLKWFQQTLQRYRENFTLASITMQGLISERATASHTTERGSTTRLPKQLEIKLASIPSTLKNYPGVHQI